MKTLKKSTKTIAIILMGIIISLYSCTGTQKVFKGNRVNYNFTTKELCACDSDKQIKSRPLTMVENSEIQVVIENFNPLKYEIIVGDTAYDRFETNIDDFTQFIKLPKISTETLKTADYGNLVYKQKSKDTVPGTSCDTLETQLKYLFELTNNLNINISNYNGYILNIKNIVNVYDYLSTLDEITADIVKESVENNIISPLNKTLLDNQQLDSLVDKVFSKKFVVFENSYYKEVAGLKDKFNKTFNIVDKIKSGDCDSQISNEDFEKLYKAFIKNYYLQLKVIDEFELIRTNTILPNFTKVMLVYDKLQNLAQNNPVFVTKSYPVNKDFQTISIYKFNPSTETKTLHDEINIQLTRGFRIDVSGGLFVSGLYDEKYTLYSKDSIFTSQHIQNGSVKDTIINDKFTAIYANSNAKVSFGGMIFLQAHSQNASMLNYGAYLGIGALFNDQTRWSGSCGASLIVGRSHRFIVNAGPIISQVDRLAKPYETNTFYQGSIDNIPISKVWKVNWMVGFSWKIGK